MLYNEETFDDLMQDLYELKVQREEQDRQSACSFLGSREGFKYLRHITDEYGKWDEQLQRYNMPITEAVDLAIQELMWNNIPYSASWDYLNTSEEDLPF